MPNKERLQAFFGQPESSGFEIFQATRGKSGEGAEIFDIPHFERRYGRPPRDGEVGAAVSHYRILREFSDSMHCATDLILVAEDDAQFSSDFERILSRITANVRNIHFLSLADPFSDAGISLVRGSGEAYTQLSWLAQFIGLSSRSGQPYRVGHYEGDLWGTGLYLASHVAAQRYVALVEEMGGIHWLADDYEYWKRLARVDVRMIRPNLAGWIGDSTIQDVPASKRRYTPEGLAASLAAAIAIRTRLRYARNSLAASLRDVADHLSSHPRC